MFNAWHKARFSGIRIVPKKSPTLFREAVKRFVIELNRTNLNGKRVSELQFLPTIVLVSIFEEMCLYRELRNVLAEVLSNPEVFMRVLNGHQRNRDVLDRCLFEASLGGMAVVSDVAKKFCDMARRDPMEPESPYFMGRIQATLRLGTYLHEAGWTSYSTDVLTIAKDMISLIKDNRSHKKLELECIQKLLRSQSYSLDPNAKQTCDMLLQLIAGVVDTNTLVKSYILIAHFYYSFDEYDQCHDWSLKAMNLITDSTSMVEDIIILLQIEAQFCFENQRYDLGNMLIAQAIHRTRPIPGKPNPYYAEVLFTYGKCLMQMNAVSDAVSTFMEALDVTTKMYGQLSPNVPVIMGHLAYGFYVRSHTTKRFDMAKDQIETAIDLAKQLTPNNKWLLENLDSLRAKILKGCNSALVGRKDNRVTKASNYEIFPLSEIRDRCVELNASFE